jgi:hypothetical protein
MIPIKNKNLEAMFLDYYYIYGAMKTKQFI